MLSKPGPRRMLRLKSVRNLQPATIKPIFLENAGSSV